ncbi:PH and SEC7 domain-containing protein 4, partial [Myotis lucifugus]|uniref:PH and SEC7 domain-containing protein 4 n=1 Tax=Myotis lucifugus TaxID=59463 RepID=UPI0006D71A63
MMDDNTLSEHPEPLEFLNVCLSDNLQPHPGVQPRETSSRPDPPGPLQELTWASDPSESTGRQDAPAGGSRAEPEGLGSGSSQGGPQQNPSSSTQVVFWAGILQAQMCVLDLEEELEKTEGLRAELRSCIPTAPVDLPPFPSSPAAPLDPGPPASPPSGEDSSRPEGESQTQVSPGEGTPDSSPEWGAEEESLFFDNPLFLESPCSDTSAPRERFSWGHPDSCADEDDDGRPESPQNLEPPLLLGRVPWGLGDEPDSGDSVSESSGHTTPPFPMRHLQTTLLLLGRT